MSIDNSQSDNQNQKDQTTQGIDHIQPNPGAVLQILCDHYIHQNNLMWNVFFQSITLQLSILAGAYGFRGTSFSPLVLLLGSTLLALLSLLIKKYQVDRDCNLGLMNDLGHICLPDGNIHNNNSMFTFVMRPKGFMSLHSGKSIMVIILMGFYAMNIIFSMLLFTNPKFLS